MRTKRRPLVDLHSLTAEVLSAANAAWYARRVLDAYVRRTAAGMIGEAEAERNRDNPTAERCATCWPVSAALADVDTAQTGPVRSFLRALTAEATAAGAGVLLVSRPEPATWASYWPDPAARPRWW